MDYSKELQKKFKDRNARVGVVGLGYVGLPLSMAFAEKGYHVTGVDVSSQKIKTLLQGQSDIPDVSKEDLRRFLEKERFVPTSDYKNLAAADVISICVPTPLRKTREPDVSFIVNAIESLAFHVRAGQLIILESTTYPGTTREIVLPRLETKQRKVGKDLFIAFSPERVDPGNPQFGIVNTPKVVGGITQTCSSLAEAFYQTVVDRVFAVSSAEAAEMVKLLENTFRAVNIGLVNEIALVCSRLNVDVWEVIDAAATKPFGFMPFRPGPGLGGHCIPVDPHYLAWKLRSLDYRVRFIELADEVNKSMPEYIVLKIADALNEKSKAIKGSKILLLGVAYKKNVGDIRESPALDIAKMLLGRGALLTFFDPFVAKLDVEGQSVTKTEELSKEVLSQFDAVVIVTDHSAVDYRQVVSQASLVIDTRNATQGLENLGRVRKL